MITTVMNGVPTLSRVRKASPAPSGRHSATAPQRSSIA